MALEVEGLSVGLRILCRLGIPQGVLLCRNCSFLAASCEGHSRDLSVNPLRTFFRSVCVLVLFLFQTVFGASEMAGNDVFL